MLNSKVHPVTWQVFFDKLSKALYAPGSPKYVRLRRVIPGMPGTGDVAHWLPLVGITYDSRDGALYVLLDGLTHRIHQPEVTWASVSSDGVYTSFLVLCRDGSKVSIELSDYHFPSDPRLYRRDPSSRSMQRWQDRTSRMWRRLMRAFPRSPRRAPDASTRTQRAQDSEADGDVQDPAAPLPSPRPGAHRPDVPRATPGDVSRLLGVYPRTVPKSDLQQQKRRLTRTTRPLRPPSLTTRSRRLDQALPNEGAGLRRELHGLHEELALTQETFRQGQQRIERLLHPSLVDSSRDAARDLLHVHARLDGLHAQAAHTAMLVQRLVGASRDLSSETTPEVILQEP